MIVAVITSIIVAAVGGVVVYRQSKKQSAPEIDVATDFKNIKAAYQAYKKQNLVALKSLDDLKAYLPETSFLSNYDYIEDKQQVFSVQPISDTVAKAVVEQHGERAYHSPKSKRIYLSLFGYIGDVQTPSVKIEYEPKEKLTTQSKITWSYQLEGIEEASVNDVQWQNQHEQYEIPGEHSVKLRVKYKVDHWTPWDEMTLNIEATNRAKRIACGSAHCFKLGDNGKVCGFGKNRYGEIGAGNLEHFHVLQPVNGLSHVSQIAVGEQHTLFMMFDRSVYTCGNNDYGQLGIGTRIHAKSIQKIWGLSDVWQVAAGPDYSGVVSANGDVYLWGHNENGQLAGDKVMYAETPIRITGISQAKRLALGTTHVLCQLQDGSLMGWGANNYGQLGNVPKAKFVMPSHCGVDDVFYVASGSNFSIVVLKSGKVIGFGANQFYQLGTGDNFDVEEPVEIAGLKQIVKVVAVDSFSLALDSNGQVYTWGRYSNNLEQAIKKPVKITLDNRVIDIAVSLGRGYALCENGNFWRWNESLTPESMETINDL